MQLRRPGASLAAWLLAKRGSRSLWERLQDVPLELQLPAAQLNCWNGQQLLCRWPRLRLTSKAEVNYGA